MRIDQTDHPLLYEINTRVWLRELAQASQKRPFTLADVPDSVLDEIAELNFDLVWLMGVWQTGKLGEDIARHHADLFAEFRRALPDLKVEDVIGSPYAVQAYCISDSLGGPAALAELRQRLAERGIGVILDFVPNHTARDHDWISSHPDYYVPGDEDSLRQEPGNYFSATTAVGKRILAHGRDPYFAGWSDTAQLNYQHKGFRAAMIETLLGIAGQCDGVRCDMAMLVLKDIFARTWGNRAQPQDGMVAEGEFWAQAIDAVRGRYPTFLFMAEAYWDLEWELQLLGFDYTYDKTLYDRLAHGGAGPVRDHLRADADYQARSVRFLENHDELRAAQVFPDQKQRGAAVITYTVPGLRFFHEGQLDGRKVRLPVQLGRRPREAADPQVREFYEKLLFELGDPVLRHGRWKQLDPRPAWEENKTWEQFVIHRWEGNHRGARVLVVNYGPEQAQCHIPLDLSHLRGRQAVLRDLLSGETFQRDGDSLCEPGLYVDLPPYHTHFLALGPPATSAPPKPPTNPANRGRGRAS